MQTARSALQPTQIYFLRMSLRDLWMAVACRPTQIKHNEPPRNSIKLQSRGSPAGHVMSIHISDHRQDRTGFSLIEVVLAIGIIAISLVAILGVFPTGLSSNRTSISDTRAAALGDAVFATIDAQTKTFSSVNCYGTTFDLASLSTTDSKTLYASYPSTSEPTISANPAL